MTVASAQSEGTIGKSINVRSIRGGTGRLRGVPSSVAGCPDLLLGRKGSR